MSMDESTVVRLRRQMQFHRYRDWTMHYKMRPSLLGVVGARWMLVPAVIFFLLAVDSSSASTNDCVPEFGKCVMPRDCCEGLSCIAGEWQYTTDSTCLSPKSAQIEQLHLTAEQRQELLAAFYQNVGATKSLQDLEYLLKKYRGKFPALVLKLERKYKTTFDLAIAKDGGAGSATAPSSEEL